MKERLTKLIKEAQERYIYAEEQAQYLMDNGVIAPPCKVGDTVYAVVIDEIEAFVVISIELAYTAKGFEGEFVSNNGKYPMLFSFKNIGKTVFLTREEAERALKGGEW